MGGKSIFGRVVLSGWKHSVKLFFLSLLQVVMNLLPPFHIGPESSEMSKNDDNQQLTIDSAIKNMNKMSSELNKLIGNQ
ncbi:hypothetical protein JD844_011945 [Phrynosoma platyrhinos]|uniref:Uncharacterized protein n=1 Tax=Phrynosoma platyrhinos TaxID=52577 RepID=A0ABQ7TIS9_PHRPL|nr:hypothetical protein JD844_011945 [Phrynosoma platyrhinos]